MGSSSHHSQRSLQGCRVLIADNDPLLTDALAEAVLRTGASVNGTHRSAREALNTLRRGGIDFAVLDINLQAWGAFRIAEALHSLQIPFVFATRFDLTMIPEQWCDIALWEKPFHAADLISALVHKLALGNYAPPPAPENQPPGVRPLPPIPLHGEYRH